MLVAYRLSCFMACGIFPDQGLNLCPLQWQVDSYPLTTREVLMHILESLCVLAKYVALFFKKSVSDIVCYRYHFSPNSMF